MYAAARHWPGGSPNKTRDTRLSVESSEELIALVKKWRKLAGAEEGRRASKQADRQSSKQAPEKREQEPRTTSHTVV